MSSLSGIVVHKMSGSGNDFVFVDARANPLAFWTAQRIRAVCDRQNGVGADGFALLEPGADASAVRLHYFNSNGLRAELCGNASLCAARLAAALELGPADGLTLETDAGRVAARCLPGPGERAEVSLGEVSGIAHPELDLLAGEQWAHHVRVGVPHLVVLVNNLETVNVAARGRDLRSNPVFGADGANVDFVAREPDGWGVRTYERGVEAETLACGTGAVAVAAVLAEAGLSPFPASLRTRSGSTLAVGGTRISPGVYRDLVLSGEGRVVFRAVLGR